MRNLVTHPHNRLLTAALTGAAACLVLVPASAPMAADAASGAAPRPADALRPAGSGECTYPAKDIKGTPWALQRVLLNQLWQDTKGRKVRVAVIDSGVDVRNPQLKEAVSVSSGVTVIKGDKGHGTTDTMGHGTRVAGIIAARPSGGTGFVGLAPQATIVPIKQYAEEDSSVDQRPTLVAAVNAAVHAHVQIINISEDTKSDYGPLRAAIAGAVSHGILVVASAGNDGAGGRLGTTYPAAYPGVLAVGASDRNNERADFSQAGTFVDIAAPGVDMVSTVPGGGQCVDQGTSFSAPYVAGVAALIKAKHPRWTPAQITARIEQTAQRTALGRNDFVGWGVIDPVRAVNDDSPPESSPTPDKGLARSSSHVIPAAVSFGESRRAHDRRVATYVLGAALLTIVVVSGGSVALRDLRRRPGREAAPGRHRPAARR
ncbi:type VII secretion-associated serine protease mycosin [Streptomyces sp. HPF1205]|uniref:type VII secretion-associated serine protease mycosin n=1 Tax=Streptomyces sp. HPF1205 TaxID=2873262 RepID=UPI001CEC6AF7|nr:type VII secretion-associated serine protease mycosin [Streptomyces sp. HPF1205]